MRGKEAAIGALRAQRAASLSLLRALDDDDWLAPCTPPWRVRDVVAHLVTIDEAAVAGRLVPLLRAASGREDIERWNDAAVPRWADEPVPGLLEALERFGTRLVAASERIPAPLWRVSARTVFGRHTLGLLLARRVLDEWVHLSDVATSTRREVIIPDGAADILASAVLDALPALALPQLEPTVGVVRLVVYTGAPGDAGEHAPRRTWAVDFARRHYGPRVTARPDATIRLHAGGLVLRSEGRTPTGAIAHVEVEGDADLAASLLDGLAGSARRP